MLNVTGERFRTAAGEFPTGVTVVTAVVEGAVSGMTANSFVTVSIDPLLVLVSLASRSRLARAAHPGMRLAISVLTDDQQEISRFFADSARPVGDGALGPRDWTVRRGARLPVVADAASYFDGHVDALVPAGDHTLLIAAVSAFSMPDPHVTPLVFWRGGYHGVSASRR
ncbi:flavin reductase family protein [Streptacidiphilus fuscans]|uniref:Flavin reductase family protein n=1 Tax=Streptacidiphilus fuscans TaxID=2789292 RepID=A0A931FFR4_9ACTN|nr:flavin reductase family protein [Streptacidiphilus fuscans]MBF9070146.1 flavin reductase family protein [Streptacidiphilus fuscans]